VHPRVAAIGFSAGEVQCAAAHLGHDLVEFLPDLAPPTPLDAVVVDLAAAGDLPDLLRKCTVASELAPPVVLLYAPDQPDQIRRAEELAAAQQVQIVSREGDWLARLPLAVHAAISAARIQRRQTEDLLSRIAAFDEERRRLDCAVECMADGLLVLDRAYRFATINPAARELLGVANLEELSHKLRAGEIDPGLHPVFWLDAHGAEAMPVRCWQERNCSKTSCPAHGQGIFPCWLYDGTLCRGDGPDSFPDKLEACYSCTVYGRNARVPDLARVRGRREVAVERPARKILQSFSAPIVDETGQFLGAVKLLRDVTSERRLEQMRSEFTSFVTHELRTPLTSILGFLQLVLRGREGEISEGQRRKLEVVLREARRLEGLVSNLLDMAAIESGRFTLDLGRFDLVPTLVETVELLRVQAASKAIELHLSVPDEPLVVVADRERVTQVLTNLIGNAIRYSGERATVTTGAWVTDGGVVVQVADTGPGIPADDIPRLFSKFFRVRSPASAVSRGSGLGLAICKGIVDAHGGRIWVESTPGQGSRFAFTIPPRQEAGMS